MNECDSMDSLMFYCPQYSIFVIFEKHLTHKQTDGLMVKASYRDVWMPLKKNNWKQFFFPFKLISTTSFLLKRVSLSIKVDSGIFDDSKHFLAIYRL